MNLDKELREIKLAQKIPEKFAELRQQANPRNMMSQQVRQEDLERSVLRDLAPPTGKTPPLAVPTGN
jgi:hypothetical protein